MNLPDVNFWIAVSFQSHWWAFDELISDERVAFAEEPDGIEAAWRSLTQLQTFSQNVWSDAYLAAFAQAADFEVVTFDRGFTQYKNVRVTVLS